MPKDNLIERLREGATRIAEIGLLMTAAACREAADEIARLKGENADLQDDKAALLADIDRRARRITDQQALIEAARAEALEEAAKVAEASQSGRRGEEPPDHRSRAIAAAIRTLIAKATEPDRAL